MLDYRVNRSRSSELSLNLDHVIINQPKLVNSLNFSQGSLFLWPNWLGPVWTKFPFFFFPTIITLDWKLLERSIPTYVISYIEMHSMSHQLGLAKCYFFQVGSRFSLISCYSYFHSVHIKFIIVINYKESFGSVLELRTKAISWKNLPN